MGKVGQKLVTIALAVLMVIGIIPGQMVHAADDIEIKQIIATSNISSLLKIGNEIDYPTFEGTTDVDYEPFVYITYFEKKDGDSWTICETGDFFTSGIYRVYVAYGLFEEEYRKYSYSEKTTLEVDGQEWTTGKLRMFSNYGAIEFMSPEFAIYEDDSLVHEIHFEVPEPKDGEKPSNNIKLTTVPANAFTSQFVDSIEGAAASGWKKSSDNVEFTDMASEEIFKAGNYYKSNLGTAFAVAMIIAGLNDKLYNTDVASGMASDYGIYVNGKKATTEGWTFVCKYDIELADVSCSEMWEYTGKEITPEPDVSFNGKKLTRGTDYTLSYKNNKNPGTATMEIKGIGLYTGTKTFYFGIEEKEKTVIDKIVAKSNISIICAAGNEIVNPIIKVNTGQPADYNPGGHPNWEKKNGNSWEKCSWDDKFTCGTYRIGCMFGLYAGNNKLYDISDKVTITVDDQLWTTDGDYVDMGTYGLIYAYSPEFVIKHDWGEWEVTTPATETSEGVETRVCKYDPSHTETRSIPKLSVAPVPTETPDVSEPPVTPAEPKKGDSYVDKSSGATYLLTSTSTVTYMSPKANVTSITIPDEIDINGKVYKVTEIKANAFKNNKKLKKVTIGKNIKKIGKYAFYGCKNLKKITVKTSKLTKKTVGKNAFGKINAKAKVKVPKKKLKAYKKMLKARGIKGKKQKITK